MVDVPSVDFNPIENAPVKEGEEFGPVLLFPVPETDASMGGFGVGRWDGWAWVFGGFQVYPKLYMSLVAAALALRIFMPCCHPGGLLEHLDDAADYVEGVDTRQRDMTQCDLEMRGNARNDGQLL